MRETAGEGLDACEAACLGHYLKIGSIAVQAALVQIQHGLRNEVEKCLRSKSAGE